MSTNEETPHTHHDYIDINFVSCSSQVIRPIFQTRKKIDYIQLEIAIKDINLEIKDSIPVWFKYLYFALLFCLVFIFFMVIYIVFDYWMNQVMDLSKCKGVILMVFLGFTILLYAFYNYCKVEIIKKIQGHLKFFSSSSMTFNFEFVDGYFSQLIKVSNKQVLYKTNFEKCNYGNINYEFTDDYEYEKAKYKFIPRNNNEIELMNYLTKDDNNVVDINVKKVEGDNETERGLLMDATNLETYRNPNKSDRSGTVLNAKNVENQHSDIVFSKSVMGFNENDILYQNSARDSCTSLLSF